MFLNPQMFCSHTFMVEDYPLLIHKTCFQPIPVRDLGDKTAKGKNENNRWDTIAIWLKGGNKLPTTCTGSLCSTSTA